MAHAAADAVRSHRGQRHPGKHHVDHAGGAAAIPFRPTDMLVFGFIVESHVCRVVAARRWQVYNIGRAWILSMFFLSSCLTCLSTALTAVVYEQRRSTYEWHKRTLETAEKLRNAEARNLLSENAASVGRLAAALSHELNSPIGALVSGVDTLLLLAARQAHSSRRSSSVCLFCKTNCENRSSSPLTGCAKLSRECSGIQTSIWRKSRRRTSTS